MTQAKKKKKKKEAKNGLDSTSTNISVQMDAHTEVISLKSEGRNTNTKDIGKCLR